MKHYVLLPAILVCLLASQIQAQQMSFPRGQFWVNGGYAYIGDEFNNDGKKVEAAQRGSIPVPLGNQTYTVNYELPYAIHFVPVHLGGFYEVYRQGPLGVQIGADLALASVTVDIQKDKLKVDASSVPADFRDAVANQVSQGIRSQAPDKAKSGFTTQGFRPFVRLGYLGFGAALSYQFDLGPEPEQPDEAENSDLQNAFILSLDATYPATPKVEILGKAEGFFTQPYKKDNVERDNGDVFTLYAGGRYHFTPSLSFLALLGYRSHTKAKVNGQEVPDSDGYCLNLGFALSYRLPQYPVTLSVMTMGTREYFTYALPLAGRTDLALAGGVLFEITYRLP